MDNDDYLIDEIAVPTFTTTIPKCLTLPSFDTPTELTEAYKNMKTEELTKIATLEGSLWVHPRTRLIFVPPTLREKIMTQFHYGQSFVCILM